MKFPMTDDIASLLEAPCREIKPVEPFPSKSNRISRGARFQHYLILFPFYPEYKKIQHLYTFNLSNRKWGSVQLRNPPQILENTYNYKVVADEEKDRFILFGCYKESQANTTGNLFFQSQKVTLKKALGSIQAKIDQGELILEWEEMEGANQLPYREKFSVNLQKEGLYIFGGCDENEILKNDMSLFRFEDKMVAKVELTNRHWGGRASLPCVRMNHGSANKYTNILIFGGEDQDSDIINDIWNFESKQASQTQCFKFKREPINRCPKLDTPSVWFGASEDGALLYIAKSTTQVLPPFKNYLCVEKFHHSMGESIALSQKEPLPFDGVPHTMVIFEEELILGFEDSIYSIPFVGKSPVPDFENYGKADGEDEGILTKKTRPKNFKGHMRQYFEEKPFPDVTFKVQGEEVSAHRGILSVRCPFFQKLFGGNESEEEKNKPIEITDLSPEGFNGLLEWLYCNEIVDFKEKMALEILKTANKYLLPKLKTEAERCLIKNLKEENVLEFAKLAVEFSARDLETAVVNFLVKERNEGKEKEELENFPESIRERVSNIEMREGKR